MLDFINSIFYGDYWYIAWTIVLIPVVLRVISWLKPIVKQIRANKNK